MMEFADKGIKTADKTLIKYLKETWTVRREMED